MPVVRRERQTLGPLQADDASEAGDLRLPEGQTPVVGGIAAEDRQGTGSPPDDIDMAAVGAHRDVTRPEESAHAGLALAVQLEEGDHAGRGVALEDGEGVVALDERLADDVDVVVVDRQPRSAVEAVHSAGAVLQRLIRVSSPFAASRSKATIEPRSTSSPKLTA